MLKNLDSYFFCFRARYLCLTSNSMYVLKTVLPIGVKLYYSDLAENHRGFRATDAGWLAQLFS